MVWAQAAHRHAGGRLAVAQQQGEDVVLAVVSGLGDQRQVGRVRSAIGIASSLLVGVRPRQRVAQPARPLVLLTLVVGAVRDLDLLHIKKAIRGCQDLSSTMRSSNVPHLSSHALDLLLSVRHADQVPVVDLIH